MFPALDVLSDHREEFPIKVGTRKGPNREMNVSYVVRGLWNDLNVRLHLSSRYFAKLLDFKLQERFFFLSLSTSLRFGRC